MVWNVICNHNFISINCNLLVVIVLNTLFCDGNHVTWYIVIFNCYSNFTYITTTIIFIDLKICCRIIYYRSIFIQAYIYTYNVMFTYHVLLLAYTIDQNIYIQMCVRIVIIVVPKKAQSYNMLANYFHDCCIN